MIENNVEMIYDISAGRIREVDLTFHRFLYSQIDWDSRLVALDGPCWKDDDVSAVSSR